MELLSLRFLALWTMLLCWHVFVWICFLFCNVPSSVTDKSSGNSTLKFLKNCQAILHSSCINLHSRQQCMKGSNLSTSLPKLIIHCLLISILVASPMAQRLKSLPAMQEAEETRLWSLDGKIPFQYRLKNPMGRGAWQATVRGVTWSRIWLSD